VGSQLHVPRRRTEVTSLTDRAGDLTQGAAAEAHLEAEPMLQAKTTVVLGCCPLDPRRLA